MKVNVRKISELQQIVRDKFKIKEEIQLEYFSDDFGEFVLLHDLSLIEAKKTKLRIKVINNF